MSPCSKAHPVDTVPATVRDTWSPADAFARKHKLSTEADKHRGLPAKLLKTELKDVGDKWAERAGHKGTHSVNEEEKLAQAGIPSPIDN